LAQDLTESELVFVLAHTCLASTPETARLVGKMLDYRLPMQSQVPGYVC